LFDPRADLDPAMPALFAAALGLFCVALLLSVVWLIQLRTRNAGMVDPVWSCSLGLLGVLYAVVGSAPLQTRVVLGVFAGAWGLRLGAHLFARNWGRPEDGRYARLRRDWAPHTARKMFWFFQLQAAIALLLSLGFLVVAYRDTEPGTVWTVLAVVVWLVSIFGEAIADRQLERFKCQPWNRGRVCSAGLWRYSRHPNYFFECLHWFTYVFLAVGTGGFWLALLPPVIMAWLLLKLSGIPITEAHLAQSRPGYAEYIRTTSAFIPWPPKRPR
jgi:steroid 5-alpha reductase family enzyme